MSKLGGATARVVKGALKARAALTLTNEAVSRIRVLLAQQNNANALKIGVRQKGCNGLTYTLEYAREKQKFDEEVEQVDFSKFLKKNLKFFFFELKILKIQFFAKNRDGIKVWIEPKAQLSLLGSEMDYVTDKLSSEFVFRNPNIKGTCGCGESFSI
ncbi:Protein CBG24933 [Caenorhabditis briggsae]|uniref:Iron-sulfur cluster assembly 1 homolog, mitochondrial n=1 Tax=Caenorhabditis briggsae TaxID=6238 RepID=B0K049_CAEBR|nr:Protein CBG24933 [Caenorhabditis briggsae]CAP21424.1 Protein CBG24933 [Caenorhabditis briggsae]